MGENLVIQSIGSCSANRNRLTWHYFLKRASTSNRSFHRSRSQGFSCFLDFAPEYYTMIHWMPWIHLISKSHLVSILCQAVSSSLRRSSDLSTSSLFRFGHKTSTIPRSVIGRAQGLEPRCGIHLLFLRKRLRVRSASMMSRCTTMLHEHAATQTYAKLHTMLGDTSGSIWGKH